MISQYYQDMERIVKILSFAIPKCSRTMCELDTKGREGCQVSCACSRLDQELDIGRREPGDAVLQPTYQRASKMRV